MRVDTISLKDNIENRELLSKWTCYACGKREVNYCLRLYKDDSKPIFSWPDNTVYVCSENCITLITLFIGELVERPYNIFGHKEC